jgi:glycosyltransferase involved in cell wall biosynthesis
MLKVMSSTIQSPQGRAEIVMTPAAAKLHDVAGLLSPESTAALDVTIFVSCYNEKEHIIKTINNVTAAFAQLGFLTYEIIIIDDCSSDGSPSIIEGYVLQHPDQRIIFRKNFINTGWAQNYIDAAFIGAGKYYRVVCGDESEPKETLVEVFKHLGEADILIPYYATTEGRSTYRLLLSRVYTAVVNGLSGFNLQYYNGLHVHLRYNVMRWHSNTRGFGFQADILCLLLGRGFSYREIPVATIERKSGRSTALGFRNFLSVAHTLFDILARRIANKIYATKKPKS